MGRTGSNSYCWSFDKTMTFVKAVKRQDFVYPVNASDHDQTGVGSSVAQETIDRILAMQEALIAQEGETSLNSAISRFGTTYMNSSDHAHNAHVRYGHSAVVHGPLKKHLEETTGKKMNGAERTRGIGSAFAKSACERARTSTPSRRTLSTEDQRTDIWTAGTSMARSCSDGST